MKYSQSISIIFCLIVAFTHPLPSQSWTSLSGPYRASDAKDITVGYSGSTRVLYVADNGSWLVKSTDSGTNWATTGTQVNNPLVAVCKPDNADIIMIGTYSSGTGKIRRSTNGGSNFSDVVSESDLELRRFGISNANSQNVFAGAAWPVYGSPNGPTLRRSTTGGETWINTDTYFLYTVHTHVLGIAWHPTDAGKVWVAGSSVQLKSATEATPEEPDMYIFGQMQEPAALEQGLWYSTNTGASWTSIANGDLSGKDIASVVALVDNGTTILLAGTVEMGNSGSQIYRSSNGGTSWTSVFTPYKGSITDLKVNTANNRVYATSNVLGVAVSTDLGATWCSGATDYNIYDHDARAIAVHPNVSDEVFIATYSSIFKGTGSSSCVSTWTQINNGITPVTVSSVTSDGTTVFAVALEFPGVCTYTSSNGWMTKYARGYENYEPFSGEYVYVVPSSPTTVIATGSMKNGGENYAVIFRSTNSGSTWTEENRSTISLSTYKFVNVIEDPKSNGRLYASGRSRGSDGSSTITTNLFLSVNNGNDWLAKPVVDGTSHDVVSLAIDPTGQSSFSDILYAAVDTRGIWKSTNAGMSWTQWSNGNSTMNAVALNPNYPSTAYAGGSSGMWKSTNSGSSWNSIRNDNVKRIIMNPSYNSSDQLFISASGGNNLYKTADAGSNWTDITNSLSTPILDLRSSTENNLIYTSNGSGVFKRDEAPAVVTGFTSTTENNHPKVTWNQSEELDWQKYEVHRYYVDCHWDINKYLCGYGHDDEIVSNITTKSTTQFTDESHIIQTGVCSGSPNIRKALYYVKVIDNGSNASSQTSNSSSYLIDCWDDEIENKLSGGSAGLAIAKPDEYNLELNYPNPFNPTTEIKYALSEDVQVSLKVYDALGREITALVEEYQTSGYKSVTFDANNLPSGLYFYRLIAGKYSKTGKMILLK